MRCVGGGYLALITTTHHRIVSPEQAILTEFRANFSPGRGRHPGLLLRRRLLLASNIADSSQCIVRRLKSSISQAGDQIHDLKCGICGQRGGKIDPAVPRLRLARPRLASSSQRHVSILACRPSHCSGLISDAEAAFSHPETSICPPAGFARLRILQFVPRTFKQVNLQRLDVIEQRFDVPRGAHDALS